MSVPRNRTHQRGQIIVIAVAVMFLLAFIAGLFLTLISRNIGRTARGGDVLQAQYLAEAGIRYADQQLTHSILGADWRPAPEATVPGDPDEPYIKAGYTRFNQGNGRFLLRVSYQPVQLDNAGDPVDATGAKTSDRSKMVYSPLGKYIKIECVGRRGVVDPNDPTTWGSQDPLRRMLVAYKPIGITDYARYETNKDRSDDTLILGSFPFALPNGNSDAYFRTSIFGPVRVNGDLMWTGLDKVVLNAAETMDTAGALPHYEPVLSTVGVNRGDTVAVAGTIFHDALPKGVTGTQVTLDGFEWSDATKNLVPLNNLTLFPSDAPDFTTARGAYRDGSAGISRTEGRVRGVSRLEPPAMDDVETSSGILRFRLLTRNTGVVPPGKSYNTGQYGLGMGIYVDNAGEIQKDTRFRRLMDEWSRTGTGREQESRAGSAWRQYLYTPPGAEIYLDPTPSRDLNTAFPTDQSQGTIVITRHDGKPWRDETGSPEGFTRRYRYPLRQVFNNTGDLVDTETYGSGGDDFRDAAGAYKTFQNGVIYLEGNVRLQGKLPADWVAPTSGAVRGQHLTIVTMGTAYIEGNLLKGDAANVTNVNGYGKGLQVGGISVIAHDYVCVNTTAYFMKQPDSGVWNFALGNPYTELAAAGEKFVTSGYSAVDPSVYNTDERGAKQELLVLSTSEGFPGAAADFTMFAYAGNNGQYMSGSLFGPGIPFTVSPGQSAAAISENIWEHRQIPLLPAPNSLDTSWALKGRALADWYALTYRPYFGPGTGGASGTEYTQSYNQPLWLSRVAVSPLDIRIEAVLYAQEGSFYVIPGEWMNGNPADTRADSLAASRRMVDPVSAGWRVQDNPGTSLYPFYGEPADIRVVICGAITENLPADKDYQTAWARHWGYTPRVRPDGTNSVHDGEGLVYMYDHDLRMPLRFDKYNRPLPPTPALPVSPDLVFFGEATG